MSWAWGFGDGATSKAQHPTHVFVQGGWHTVTLTTTDNDGGVASLARDVYVCAPGAQVESLFSPGHVRVAFESCVRLAGLPG